MKQWIIAIALILPLLAGSISCAQQGELSGQLKILSQSMTVHEFSGGAPQSVAVVYGRAQNVSHDAMNYATIAVNFYDKNKKLIATDSASKQNLQPGEIWDFSVQTVGPDAWKIVSYDIAVSAK
jgi:hypothetical protein